ncbi:Sensory box histidine kinase/response regulator [Fimbriimonas ginsengisoli Gsoil 348]|uniref:Circadian input-output histidine kinase CikA n=1 Tax=Fimbriimonas ginsengisoli Gsoil 348 TaxID=661478 RepID=A0A068NPH3_FIMGI|nr:Sensory box histidine kinase/response regulator [Fimbriimonas ginsengisoli Gsoil 348]
MPSILIWIAAWTDNSLHLLRRNITLSEYESYNAVNFSPGPAYYTNVAVSYLFLATSVAVLIRVLRSRNRLSRKHAQVVLIGMVLPVVGNVSRLFGFEPIPGVDPTPALFALSAVSAAYGVFRYSLFSVAPIARDKVVDDLADGVIVLDAQGHIVDVNPAAARLFGMSLDAMTRLIVADLDPFLGGRTIAECCGTIVPFGERAYFLRCVPVSGSDRDPLGTILQLTDVTDQQRVEDALRKAKEVAEEASATKSRFVANVSHELRTPLNGVIGLGELLGKTTLGTDQREYLTGILHCSDALLGLINNVLDLSKIEANAMTMAQEPVDVGELVRRVTSVHRNLAERKGLEVVHEVAGIPPAVMGDPLRLGQILNNLIGNAVKFTEKGRVTVLVHPYEEDRYEIVVRDTGIGIPQEMQEAVFGAFQQADASTTRQYGGSGLGLPITAGLVREMGGTLNLESAVGKGTEVRVSLPLVAAQPIASAEPEAAVSTEGMRVLVAEDNDVNALVIVSVLEDFGCVVEHALDGLEALEALERADFDLVLMDIQMPRMDGLEAVRTLRERWPNRHIYVCALTANALEEERQRSMEVGMDGFLTKPVRSEEVKKTLIAALSSRSARPL